MSHPVVVQAARLNDDRPVPVLRVVVGPVEIGRSDGAADDVHGRLGRLLVALVLEAGTVVSSDRLADTVWADAAARRPPRPRAGRRAVRG